LIAAAIVGVLLAAALGSLTLPAILNPEVAEHVRSDAVFIHVGGRGERLETALRLMDDGVADVLVIPTQPTDEWPEGRRACTTGAAYEVICASSTPSNTHEEALLLAQLAADHGWASVTVVTNDYHMARTTMLDRSCTRIELIPVPVEPEGLNLFEHGWKVLHEVIGIPYSWLLQRCET
jgi:uncharacterized SAM-binding protein YcdF (DUF218 family)